RSSASNPSRSQSLADSICRRTEKKGPVRTGPCESGTGFGSERLRQVVEVRLLGRAQRPRAASLGVLDRLLDLGLGEIALDLQLLAGIDQVGVFDLVAVVLEDERPLVGIVVDLAVAGDPPKVL